MALQWKKCSWYISVNQFISAMTTLSVWHGNEYDNVDIFGLGRIDLLRCCCCRVKVRSHCTFRPIDFHSYPCECVRAETQACHITTVAASNEILHVQSNRGLSTGLATANTYKTRCCEQVKHAAAVQYSVHDWPVADLFRWSWGRWRVSESTLHC